MRPAHFTKRPQTFDAFDLEHLKGSQVSLSPPRALRSAPERPLAEPPAPVAIVAGFESSYGKRLSACVSASRRLSVIGEGLPWHCLAASLELHHPDVALVCNEALDVVEMAGLVRAHPQTGVVVVAHHLSEARARTLDDCGVAAMLERSLDQWLLVLLTVAVARGIRGGLRMSAPPAATEPTDRRLASLSPREAVVLELLKEHRSLAEIAAALGVTRATVSSHAQSIYGKLGVSGRDQLRLLLQSLQPVAPRSEPAVLATRERVAFSAPTRPRHEPRWVTRPLAGLTRPATA